MTTTSANQYHNSRLIEKIRGPMHTFFPNARRLAEGTQSSPQFQNECRRLFADTIEIVWQSLGSAAFRPEGAINAAVMDSVMVGLAKRLDLTPHLAPTNLKPAYEKLLQDKEYMQAVTRGTSNESNVETRLRKSISLFEQA